MLQENKTLYLANYLRILLSLLFYISATIATQTATYLEALSYFIASTLMLVWGIILFILIKKNKTKKWFSTFTIFFDLFLIYGVFTAYIYQSTEFAVNFWRVPPFFIPIPL
ncbi:MAG: hypothetical protein KatS3mg129_1171 [Leptospiraceae bacterium]|nr:MAG: hypothetical protein KatS3mg129_1171 [Leptospiraceae bacterium]